MNLLQELQRRMGIDFRDSFQKAEDGITAWEKDKMRNRNSEQALRGNKDHLAILIGHADTDEDPNLKVFWVNGAKIRIVNDDLHAAVEQFVNQATNEGMLQHELAGIRAMGINVKDLGPIFTIVGKSPAPLPVEQQVYPAQQ